jgi:hypothetical protein
MHLIREDEKRGAAGVPSSGSDLHAGAPAGPADER